MEAQILELKTVTTIRPYFFDDKAPAIHLRHDVDLCCAVASVDLGHLHWNRQLEEKRLNGFLQLERAAQGSDIVSHRLDIQAVNASGKVKRLLGSFGERMLTPDEIILCFRVLQRCAALVSKYEPAFEVHLARGLVAKEYNQYSLAEVLAAAEKPQQTRLGQYMSELLRDTGVLDKPTAVVVHLRNDGELNQAMLIASLIKQLSPATATVLDASGANEQYNFGEWAPALTREREKVSQFFDYFLPRQDYMATLRPLLKSIVAGSRPKQNPDSNLVAFGNQTTSGETLQPESIDRSFARYIDGLPIFQTAGRRTIVGRLSASKCHWAACKFCTINSQHLMPRGLAVFDGHYQRDLDILVRKIRRDHVESVILMDEALHPNVLLAFASRLLSQGVSIVYRARCRFTNDFTPEACRKLYESGCRYLGLGLEAASPRVNAMVNKHMGTPIDYDVVLQNLEDADIRMHIYAILGFPTETREEIERTATFLLERIGRFRYLTVSANTFHLMRGSAIAASPEEFNIEGTAEAGDLALVLQFEERERTRNYAFSEESVQRIFQAEFLPEAEDPGSGQALWHFIDQTGIFYVQKVEHSKNPFHALCERRKRPLGEDFIDACYEPSFLFWTSMSEDEDDVLLCDWVTNNYARVPDWLRDLVQGFDSSRTLRANAEQFLPASQRELAYGAFRMLVESGFFRLKEDESAAPEGRPLESIFTDPTARAAAAGSVSFVDNLPVMAATSEARA